MSATRYHLAKSLFLRARGLDPDSAAALLDRDCAGDAQLRSEVEGLLAFCAPALEDDGPQRIAHYRIVRELGEGGFGIVYEAAEDGPIRRSVALKVLKPGMDSRAIVARFGAERQALALMDHPGIARVFEAGAEENDRPYFAMELVRGPTITEYCDAHRLTVETRLNLFASVCDATHHAHTKGVVHRDIKPGNILVEEHEGSPRPKVIDFGIAKAIDSPLTDQTLITTEGMVFGTPEYMAPEQAAQRSADVDTRTDIYSLGVVLYQLLTSSLPFDRQTLLAEGLDSLRAVLGGIEPPRPSARLESMLGSENQRAAQDAAAARRTDARSLVRRLRGDLDWVTMRCLEKDPSRRYASAAALADDVRRHLAHDVVLAGPPSVRYRVSKTLRRHRGAFLAGGAFAALLIAATATAATLALGQWRARRLAEHETMIASALDRILTEDVIGAADPTTSSRYDMTLREALEEVGAMLPERFAEDPLARARVQVTIGRSLRGLGANPEAERQFGLAYQSRLSLLGPGAEGTLEAAVELSGAMLAQGRVGDALPLLETTLADAEAALGPAAEITLDAANNLASTLQRAGRFAEAAALFEEVIRRRTAAGHRRSIDMAPVLNNYASVLGRLGRHAEAEPVARESVEIRARVYGPDDPRTITGVNTLAVILQKLGRLDEAAELQTRVLEVRRARLPAGSPAIGTALNNLAQLRREQDRPAEAIPLLEEALTIERQDPGRDAGRVLMLSGTLGLCYLDTGRGDLAEPLLRDTLEQARRAFGADNWILGMHLTDYGWCLLDAGRAAESVPLFEEALGIFSRRLPPGHPRTVQVLQHLARAADATGDPEGAQAWRARLAEVGAPARTPAPAPAPARED